MIITVLVQTSSVSDGGLVLSGFVHFSLVNNNIFTPQECIGDTSDNQNVCCCLSLLVCGVCLYYGGKGFLFLSVRPLLSH